MRKLKKGFAAKLVLLLFLIVGTAYIVRQQRVTPYQHESGFVFGTVYNITYQCDRSLKSDIEAALRKVDNSLSAFNSGSVISRINRNEQVEADKMFCDVFTLAMQVSKETDGAFDITVAPLVNLWGFGFKNDSTPTKHKVDSLRRFVGYEKVSLIGKTVRKQDKRIMLDCSAIAKGYGSDVVAASLRSRGVDNYMVEIGGEVVVRGVNEQRLPWRIGVTKPSDDSVQANKEIQTVLNITNKAMATSGNYRNFYYRNGRKYAHTIDPKTGYPVQHSILSATVIADNCATADAYATSFMVLGIERAKAVLSRHPELSAYFIYADRHGRNATWCSPKLKDKLTE